MTNWKAHELAKPYRRFSAADGGLITIVGGPDVAARSAAWRAANPERARASSSAWKADHPEQNRAAVKAWAAANPERRRTREARRRARKASVRSTLTPQEWDTILEAAGHACIYCGSADQLTQDHLAPISKGGEHTAENVAPACKPCNTSKGAKTVMEFLAERGTAR